MQYDAHQMIYVKHWLVFMHLLGAGTVSAFAGKATLKALKIMMTQKYVAAFIVFGISWMMEDDDLQTLEELVCALYRGSGISVTNYVITSTD